jgi:hypothetical protein
VHDVSASRHAAKGELMRLNLRNSLPRPGSEENTNEAARFVSFRPAYKMLFCGSMKQI